MKQVSGFSLIECLIYCALLALLSMLTFGYFTRQNYALRAFVAAGQHRMECYVSLQLIAADIIQADSRAGLWHQTHDESIFKVSDVSVAWRLHENNLYRTKGVYDFTRHVWENKSTALVARHVAAFSIQTEEKNGRITVVKICADSNSRRHQRMIPLMNRVLG